MGSSGVRDIETGGPGLRRDHPCRLLLHGIGSATADRPIGLTLVVVNSIAVSLAGLIGFRLVRDADRNVGRGYLVARVAEAVLLAGGSLMAERAGAGDTDTNGHLLAMIALSVGSIAFCHWKVEPENGQRPSGEGL